MADVGIAGGAVARIGGELRARREIGATGLPLLPGAAAAHVAAVRLAGESGLLTMLHCEDQALLADAAAQLVAAGRTSLRHYADSRPVVAEVAATQRAVAIAEATGAPVYVVHVSCARALEVSAEAQAPGLPGRVETPSLYLPLTSQPPA